MNDIRDIAVRGIVGVTFPILGAITSWQEHFEWGLRVASLMVGITVGVASLISILRKK